MEELKAEADTIRNSIKAEMEAREVEELIAGQYIVRYTSVLSNRCHVIDLASAAQGADVFQHIRSMICCG